MSKPMRECRVCGKKYAACVSARSDSPVFNWRRVACSPECGEIYLELIRESRIKTRDVGYIGQFSVVGEQNDDSGFVEEYAAEYIAADACDDDQCGDEPF